ncbi:hypothetical protein KGF57_003019 [Candida theae]|uniref:Uncharacterized protein n=1 Tax=Candida theae TaxID=1198502 RepID=A0AAD5BED1_9ASCO|nr:uncharacterized protein KGF57_003019 [Candida theae]KAI5957753.1 hypothetical protein KGF57_003019 [Candida theae]
MSQEISLSLEETNKIRIQLGLEPIVEKPATQSNVIELSLEETNKLRLSLGLKPIPDESSTTNTAKGVESKSINRVNDELLSQKLTKAKVASEKRKLMETSQEGDDDEIDTDSWLSKVGNSQSTKKQKIEQVPSIKDSHLVNAHIGHSTRELQNLRNNDILTLQDTNLLNDDDDDDGEGDVLVNEALTAEAKVKNNLKERREAEMIKFNGRHYRRNNDEDDDDEGDRMDKGNRTDGVIKKKPVVIKNSNINLNKSAEVEMDKAESLPVNTMKFSNFFGNLEKELSGESTPKPQIKMKKLKTRKPFEGAKRIASPRVKIDDFEQLPNIDENEYDNLQESLVANASKSRSQRARQKMTPEEIAIEIARNKKIAMERRLEEESMRRQYSALLSNEIQGVEDLDTLGFLSNLENNILGENNGEEQDTIDEDIFDSHEKQVNGTIHGHTSDGAKTSQVNGRMSSSTNDPKENSPEAVTMETDQQKSQTRGASENENDNHPRFNTGLADTLKFLKSRTNDNSILQNRSDTSSISIREELSKQTELLKLKVDIEERILRDELSTNKEYMKLSKLDREVQFEVELDKRLAEKGIVVESGQSKRFNQSNGRKTRSGNKSVTSEKNSTLGSSSGSDGDKYSTYNPKVELHYKDDEGQSLDTKQAYKHLSHKYHGMTTSQRLAKSMKKREKEKIGKGPVTRESIVD